MVVGDSTIIADSFKFIRTLLLNGLTDPIQARRTSDSKFVTTGYPDRRTEYPCITVRNANFSAERLGMRTENMKFPISVEVRIWARDEREKDELTDAVVALLRTKQIDAVGTVNERLYNFAITSAVNVDEEGDNAICSKILNCTYDVYTGQS